MTHNTERDDLVVKITPSGISYIHTEAKKTITFPTLDTENQMGSAQVGGCANVEVSEREFWEYKGADGFWVEPKYERREHAAERAAELGTAYRRTIIRVSTQEFNVSQEQAGPDRG